MKTEKIFDLLRSLWKDDKGKNGEFEAGYNAGLSAVKCLIEKEDSSNDSDIKDAAETELKSVQPISLGFTNGEPYGIYDDSQMLEMFKAGVKWVSEQGFIVEGITGGDVCNADEFYFSGIREFWGVLKFKMPLGKIIVQIRKG